MKVVAAGVLGVVLVVWSQTTDQVRRASADVVVPVHHAAAVAAPALTPAELTKVVQKYCVVCHNDQMLTGNLSLQSFQVENPAARAETAEKMIVKLRAGMMPPPGAPRPSPDTLLELVSTLEQSMDKAAAADPNPGTRVFQRLNRAEYQASIKALLELDIDAGHYFPLDTKSANFDNIADVQMLSATMMDAYLRAADDISRLAVGVADAGSTSVTYTNSGYTSQWEHVPGAPYGTRGGISVVHTFPADGDYHLDLWFEHTTTGEFTGGVTPGEQIELSIDGERAQLLEVDRFMHVSDPNGMKLSMDPLHITSGPHRISASFLKTFEGPVEDILSPHDWSLSDRKIGSGGGYGITVLAHIKDLVIVGPSNQTGVSETPSRKAIFVCRPTKTEESRRCAQQIVTRLASNAFRRPLEASDVAELMAFYDQHANESFDRGIRTAVQAILASPDFVFRLEQAPDQISEGQNYRITDEALATRLSFFLWGSPPDTQLMDLAKRGRLHDQSVLIQQAKRMLVDPRAAALGSRFAAQWLRLDDMEKVNPDRLMFPDYHKQLADAMRRETELFFDNLVKEDRSVLDLYSADYTFVNERLARHYGIQGVAGEQFQKVSYPAGTPRRGLFGHASILVLTSHANRTSPVLRGKWVMEVLLGTPPPPPPPGVPPLDQTAEAANGRELTTRERMEMHRKATTCNACHRFMDPIGLSLDNFDVTGKWRIRENGANLDTRGQLYDGTPVSNPSELQQALLKRPIPLIRTFTANLMAYGLGRRLESFDQPQVRKIAADAQANGNKMSSFVLGVIQSDAFQMKRAIAVTQQNQ
ncbi:MAG: DUF1592 domain-containing protein [Gemmatimonadetes bacterium]|nr:DUF1592 domain-containing protein [Gemmatimonadota bacterium]